MFNSKKTSITEQPQDVIRDGINNEIENNPVTLKNSLPFHIVVFQERDDLSYSGSRRLSQLRPNESIEVTPGVIKTGDLLHFMYFGPSVKSQGHFVTPSILVRKHLGIINIGSVVSAQGGYNRDIHPNGDISSVRIHNMLPWPLYISHNNKRVGFVGGNRTLGTKEHGNMLASPAIYFDNGNMGLKLGDKFQIFVDNSLAPEIPRYLYSFSVVDRNVSEIFIGQGSTETDSSHKPENYAYNLGLSHFPRTHNALGTDLHRQKGNRIPIAKYRALSGNNVVTF